MDLSIDSLMFGVIFSCMGFAVLQIGRKRDDVKKIAIGILLMAGTFILGSEWYTWIGATGLLIFAFYP